MHQPKDRLAGRMKTCACMHFHFHITLLDPLPQIVCDFFILLLIMFSLWLAFVTIFYIFVWLLIVKTDKHLLLLNYVTMT